MVHQQEVLEALARAVVMTPRTVAGCRVGEARQDQAELALTLLVAPERSCALEHCPWGANLRRVEGYLDVTSSGTGLTR